MDRFDVDRLRADVISGKLDALLAEAAGWRAEEGIAKLRALGYDLGPVGDPPPTDEERASDP